MFLYRILAPSNEKYYQIIAERNLFEKKNYSEREHTFVSNTNFSLEFNFFFFFARFFSVQLIFCYFIRKKKWLLVWQL